MRTKKTSHRSRFQLLALTIMLGLAAVGLTQCRSVTDRVLGVDLRAPQSLSLRNACTHQCDATFRAAVYAEAVRYRDARRVCGHDVSCRRDEDRRHFALLQQIIKDLHDCKRNCYNEGGGSSQ